MVMRSSGGGAIARNKKRRQPATPDFVADLGEWAEGYQKYSKGSSKKEEWVTSIRSRPRLLTNPADENWGRGDPGKSAQLGKKKEEDYHL